MKSVATSMASIAGCNETEDLNEVTGISRVLLAFLLTAFLVCVSVIYFIPVPMVYAHGGPGDAAPPEGSVSLVSFAGFQAELLTAPRPARAGEDTKIIINRLRNASLQPVRQATVSMGISRSALRDRVAGSKFIGTGTADKAWVPFIALSRVFMLINLDMLNRPMGMRYGL
jgi:hypothetical protein